ncbi:hypothetical protein [Naumannella cuiyingiana]|uniref:Integral membrane protein n=1 Tax=Naumannella cuiyingiana TaxID=1347891 RepID=A0A7Z0D8R0_9ACTN|nr:hypothetical protein [Naumannella cuiyingiana]NYI70890.1 hypothetical protein [Naumannella cuiyingiana]
MLVLPYALGVVALLLALFAGYHAWRELRVSNLLIYGIGLLELGVLVQLGVFAAALVATGRVVDGPVLVAYLIAAVVVPPAATIWGIADASRWGPGVLAIGLVAVAVLCLRVASIWSAVPAAGG